MTAKEQKMFTFYEECLNKGYLNMQDGTQSLKAKVIASDLGLRYGNIEKLFSEAKTVYEREMQLREAEDRKQVMEKERLAVNGEHILTLVFDSSPKAKVFRRPDGSLYAIFENSHDKVEGVSISSAQGGVLTYKYHPSKTVYTGASSGGISMGGFHQTDAYYTEGVTKTGKGDVVAVIGENKMNVNEVLIPESVQQAFKRDSAFKLLAPRGSIDCYDPSGAALASNTLKAIMASGKSFAEKTAMASQAVDMKKLPMSKCVEIVTLLGRILNHNYPDTDDVLYEKAETLSKGTTSKELKEAADIFNNISDYRDAKEKAVNLQRRYEDVLQAEKEQKILDKEAAKKKNVKIAIIIAAVLAVAVLGVFVGQRVIKNVRYSSAQTMLEEGRYDEAIAAFTALGDYENSSEMLPECNYQKAVFMLETDEYEEALTLFTELGNYKDSPQKITEVRQKQYELADRLESENDLQGALGIFQALGSFQDSEERVKSVEAKLKELEKEKELEHAVSLLDSGRPDEALQVLAGLKGFKNADEYLADYYYLPVKLVNRANSDFTDQIYTFEYDTDGYMIGAKHEYATNSGVKTYEAVFDDEHQLISGFYNSKTIDYNYDTNEILVKMSDTSKFGHIHDKETGNIVGYVSDKGKVYYSSLKHDKSHNRVTEDGGTKSSITNTYDELGRLTDVTTIFNNYHAVTNISYKVVYSPNRAIDMDLVWRNFRILCEDEIWF